MVERITAVKCAIGDLIGSTYVVKEGSAPSYLETPRGRVSRCNVIAAVVDKPGSRSLLLDDGSGRIEARAFDNEKLFENVMVGDIVLLVGRPRQYQGQKYLVAEIAKRLASPKWLELRKKELGTSGVRSAARVDAAKPVVKPAAKPMARTEPATKKAESGETVAVPSDRVLALIRELDTGQGAPIEAVIEKSGQKETETILTDLMAEGEIFEIRPGRVKVLE